MAQQGEGGPSGEDPEGRERTCSDEERTEGLLEKQDGENAAKEEGADRSSHPWNTLAEDSAGDSGQPVQGLPWSFSSPTQSTGDRDGLPLSHGHQSVEATAEREADWGKARVPGGEVEKGSSRPRSSEQLQRTGSRSEWITHQDCGGDKKKRSRGKVRQQGARREVCVGSRGAVCSAAASGPRLRSPDNKPDTRKEGRETKKGKRRKNTRRLVKRETEQTDWDFAWALQEDFVLESSLQSYREEQERLRAVEEEATSWLPASAFSARSRTQRGRRFRWVSSSADSSWSSASSSPSSPERGGADSGSWRRQRRQEEDPAEGGGGGKRSSSSSSSTSSRDRSSPPSCRSRGEVSLPVS